MHYKDLNKAGYRVIFMLAEFLLLLASLIYLDYLYLMKVRPDQLATQHFVRAECFIVSKKLGTKGSFNRRYRADFLISYQAKGTQYTRWVSGNGLDRSYFSNSLAQEQILSNYGDGSNNTCWYDPDNPESVYLVPREFWSYFTPFLWPTVIGVLAGILFIKNAYLILMLNKKNKLKI